MLNRLVAAGFALLWFGGCVSGSGGSVQSSVDVARGRVLADESFSILRASAGHASPAVRSAAIEALELSGRPEALPRIRLALRDDHPAVRFAACVAVGRLRDGLSRESLDDLVSDSDASVGVAARYALHRLGDHRLSGQLPSFLLDQEDPVVRRNAAMLFGLLGERSAVRVLARAMRDSDEGVRHYALEALARLGNAEALQELSFMTSTGIGADEVFAIQALERTGNPRFLEAFRHKLRGATHVETRLAAAAALGSLGVADGLPLAIRSLDRPPVRQQESPEDSPEIQRARIRLMAAQALRRIGHTDALRSLGRCLRAEEDPLIRVAAASAVLSILDGPSGSSSRTSSGF